MNAMKKTVLATALFMAMGSAYAAPVAINATSDFQMYNPVGGYVGGAPAGTLTGFIDTAAGTWGVASATPFFGIGWTASGGTLYGAGTHTVSTVDAAPGVSGGSYTFTVGANQLAGMIDFSWGGTTGIDVLNVWNVSTAGGVTTYTSTDVNLDGILGIGMIDGPFPGFNANFNMATPAAVPVPAAAWLLGSGLLGLVGVARRKVAVA